MFEYFSVEKFTSKLCPSVSFKLRKMSKGRRSSFQLKIAKLILRKTELQQSLSPISEEINRAEEQAKLEPCTCSHPMDQELIKDKLEALAEINKSLAKPIEIVHVCHSSTTKRCIVDGCGCRKPKPDTTIGDYGKYQQIMDEIVALEVNEIGAERLRFFISEVQGLKIDGVDADVESLIMDGPEALVDEVSTELSRLLTLSQEDALGFKQPTTGGAAVESQGSSTDQPTVDPVDKASSTSSATASSTTQT